MMLLEIFSEGCIRYKLPHLDLCFQLQMLGANRIPQIPKSVVPVLFADERFVFVKGLLVSYQKAISAIGEKFDWEAPEDPLICCVKFSELIVSAKFHLRQELSLQDLGISLLPPHMALFQSVTHLDLSGNNLRRLFPELTSLETLEVLDISGNKDIDLPDLSALPNLRVIKANRCNWGEIPAWMEQSKSLEEIELRGNKIQIVPNGLRKTYDLAGNPEEF